MISASRPVSQFAGLAIATAALLVTTSTAQQTFFESTPTSVNLGTSQSDDGPTMSDDETYMVFASLRSGNVGDYDLWEAHRPSVNAPWGSFSNLTALNSTSLERGPSLSRDGKELYFFSRRSGSEQIYVSTRASTSAAFGAPTLVPGLTSRCGRPNLTDDGLTLFYVDVRAFPYRIHTATRSAIGAPFVDQGRFPPTDDGNCDNSPTPFANGNILYLVSNTRNGGVCNSTPGDAYFCYRDATTGNWSAVTAMTAINTPAGERGIFRGRTTGDFYVSRHRTGGSYRIEKHAFRAAMLSVPRHPAESMTVHRRSSTSGWDIPWLDAQRTRWSLNSTVQVGMFSDRPGTANWFLLMSFSIASAPPLPVQQRGNLELLIAGPFPVVMGAAPQGPDGAGRVSIPIGNSLNALGTTAAIQGVGIAGNFASLDWTVPGTLEIVN